MGLEADRVSYKETKKIIKDHYRLAYFRGALVILCCLASLYMWARVLIGAIIFSPTWWLSLILSFAYCYAPLVYIMERSKGNGLIDSELVKNGFELLNTYERMYGKSVCDE